jgi:hypothetical protein
MYYIRYSRIANTECYNNAMAALRPQDVVVILKLCRYGSARPPISHLALELGMSPSETHGAIKRGQVARLLHGHELQERPNLSALEEFLLHGVKYAFPPQRGDLTRGLATSYAAPPLNQFITVGDEPIPVWPFAEGNQRGLAFEPLYKTVPQAAQRDPFLYECLALVDAIRDGRMRERQLAEKELTKRLRAVVND